jgi:hypothetical protein
MGPFGFGDRSIIDHVIDLSIVASQSPLIIKVGDGENCTVGGKVVGLLWRLGDL